MQGQLRGAALSVNIETECVHCGKPLHIEVDSELKHFMVKEDTNPLVFIPLVDFDKLTDPSIIDAF